MPVRGRHAGHGEPAILAEGEFDALLLWRDVGDLVGVATLGSCNRGLSGRALRYLLGCPRLLVAYDVDAEGEKGAQRFTATVTSHAPHPADGGQGTWRRSGRLADECGTGYGSSWRGVQAGRAVAGRCSTAA